MSGTSNLQNVLANVIRPVYVYDPVASNYVAKVIVSNVDTFSVRTIEVENLEFGDANRNLYLGVDAGSTNSNSASNVAIGYGAAENNINTKNSVFLGYTAGGQNITDASATVAIGANTRSGGSSNVYVGYGTGSDSNTASGNIFVGPSLTMASAVSNQVRIGTGTTVPFSADMNNGYVGINTSNPAYALDVVGTTTNLRGSLRVAGGTTMASGQPSTVEIGNGDDATGSTNRSVMSLQYWIGGYRHMIRSRHDASANSAGNAIDLFVNNSDTATGSSQPGTGNVLALSATAVGVGIGTSNPTSELDVSGTVRASGFISTGGATSFGNVILSSGGVQLLDGSSTNPTLTFQNDLSLGLYRAGSNSLGITTAGLERVRIDSNGRLGVGLSNPAYSVDVSGIIRATGFIGTSGSGSSGGVVFNNGAVALQDGSLALPTLTFQNDLSLGLYRRAPDVLGFVSAGIDRMTMSNGNFGIATTAPAYTLDVSGTTRASNSIVSGYLRDALAPSQFDISSGTMFLSNRILTGAGTVSAPAYAFAGDVSMGLYDPSTNVLGLVTAGVERMRVASDGAVGIGTSNVFTRLQVNPKVVDDAGVTYDSSAVMFVQPTPTGTTALNDPTAVLYLARQGTAAQSYGARSTFKLSRYENSGTSSRTRMDIELANDMFDEVPVMTMRSDRRVGISTTAPRATLDVSGNAIVTGYLRDASSGFTFDISGGNISNSNSIQTGNPGDKNLYGTLEIGKGYTATYAGGTPAVSFQYQGATGGYRHFLMSRHNSAGASAGNALDFFMSTGGTSTSSTAPGTGNALAMTVTSAGVGISNSAPGYVLDVSGGGSGVVTTMQVRNTGDQAGIRVTGNGLPDTSGIRLYHRTSDHGLLSATTNPMQFWTNNTQRVTIDGSGSMGIGTTTPSSNLNVNGTGLVVAGNMRMGTATTSYRQFSLGGGNSYGFLYGAFSKHSDGINIAYNFYNDNTSNVIPNAGGQTARLQIGYGVIQMYTGAANTEPTALGYYQNSNGRVGIGTNAPNSTVTIDVSGNARILRDGSSSLTSWGVNTGADTLTLQHSGAYTNTADLGKAASLFFGNATANYPQARIASEMTAVTPSGFAGNLIFQTGSGTALVERMRIDSNGRIGIATTAPAYTLDVSSSSTTTAIFRNTTAQASIMVVGAGAADGNGIQLYHNSTEQGLYANVTNIPLYLWTNNSRRVAVTSGGNMGIGTNLTAPVARLDVVGGITAFGLSNNAVPRPALDTSTNVPTYELRAKSASGPTGDDGFVRIRGGGGTSTTTASYIDVAGYSDVTDLTRTIVFGTAGVEAARFNSNGNFGIGTKNPLYELDVSAAPTTASINMTTWPRTTMSTTFYGAYSGTAGGGANCIVWTTSNSIDSNIITVGSNTGTYFVINKSGIYSFNLYVNGTTAGTPLLMIDCSTNIAHDTPSSLAQRQITYNVGSSSVGQLSTSFTGFLPSNSGIYYKAKVTSLTPSAGAAGARLTISFLGETPAVTGFPF